LKSFFSIFITGGCVRWIRWLAAFCVCETVCVCVCSSVAQKVGMRYMRRIAAQPNGGRQSDGKKKIYIYIARLYCISICSCRCAFL